MIMQNILFYGFLFIAHNIFLEVIFMLPKLQQSSLAQSLRRDNPATLIQSITVIMHSRRPTQKYSWKSQQ